VCEPFTLYANTATRGYGPTLTPPRLCCGRTAGDRLADSLRTSGGGARQRLGHRLLPCRSWHVLKSGEVENDLSICSRLSMTTPTASGDPRSPSPTVVRAICAHALPTFDDVRLLTPRPSRGDPGRTSTDYHVFPLLSQPLQYQVGLSCATPFTRSAFRSRRSFRSIRRSPPRLARLPIAGTVSHLWRGSIWVESPPLGPGAPRDDDLPRCAVPRSSTSNGPCPTARRVRVIACCPVRMPRLTGPGVPNSQQSRGVRAQLPCFPVPDQGRAR